MGSKVLVWLGPCLLGLPGSLKTTHGEEGRRRFASNEGKKKTEKKRAVRFEPFRSAFHACRIPRVQSWL